MQLETHNQQLKNIIKKETATGDAPVVENRRKFDFTKWVVVKFIMLNKQRN